MPKHSNPTEKDKIHLQNWLNIDFPLQLTKYEKQADSKAKKSLLLDLKRLHDEAVTLLRQGHYDEAYDIATLGKTILKGANDFHESGDESHFKKVCVDSFKEISSALSSPILVKKLAIFQRLSESIEKLRIGIKSEQLIPSIQSLQTMKRHEELRDIIQNNIDKTRQLYSTVRNTTIKPFLLTLNTLAGKTLSYLDKGQYDTAHNLTKMNHDLWKGINDLCTDSRNQPHFKQVCESRFKEIKQQLSQEDFQEISYILLSLAETIEKLGVGLTKQDLISQPSSTVHTSRFFTQTSENAQGFPSKPDSTQTKPK